MADSSKWRALHVDTLPVHYRIGVAYMRVNLWCGQASTGCILLLAAGTHCMHRLQRNMSVSYGTLCYKVVDF